QPVASFAHRPGYRQRLRRRPASNTRDNAHSPPPSREIAQPPLSGNDITTQSPSGQSAGSSAAPVSSCSHVKTGYGTPYTLTPDPQGLTPREVTPATRNSPFSSCTNAGPPESPPHASWPSPPARNSRLDF